MSGFELGVVVAGNLLSLVVLPLLVPDVRIVFALFGGLALGFAILWDSLRVDSGDWR